MATAKTRKSSHAETVMRHWREAVPNDRLAHLVKDATRGLVRALTMRLAEHQVAFGHWAFLRILWETDGLTQRELSLQAGVMEPTTFAAISKAVTGAYLSSSQGNAFSTRTANQIIQEHFDPGVAGTPSGPLFGVQFSQLNHEGSSTHLQQ